MEASGGLQLGFVLVIHMLVLLVSASCVDEDLRLCF